MIERIKEINHALPNKPASFCTNFSGNTQKKWQVFFGSPNLLVSTPQCLVGEGWMPAELKPTYSSKESWVVWNQWGAGSGNTELTLLSGGRFSNIFAILIKEGCLEPWQDHDSSHLFSSQHFESLLKLLGLKRPNPLSSSYCKWVCTWFSTHGSARVFWAVEQNKWKFSYK